MFSRGLTIAAYYLSDAGTQCHCFDIYQKELRCCCHLWQAPLLVADLMALVCLYLEQKTPCSAYNPPDQQRSKLNSRIFKSDSNIPNHLTRRCRHHRICSSCLRELARLSHTPVQRLLHYTRRTDAVTKHSPPEFHYLFCQVFLAGLELSHQTSVH